MNKNSGHALFVSLLVFLCVDSAVCIELKNSVFDSAFHANIYAFNLGADEFDDEPTDKPVRNNNDRQVPEGKRKSRTKAILLSALVPGAGEYYLGDRRKARYFFVAEGLSILSFVTFKVYSNWKEDDYIRLAASNASARLEGKSDEFVDLVGFYDNVDLYNTAGRVIEPSREYYHPNNLDTYWRWENPEDRDMFRTLKNSSREADRRSEFALGAMVVTRFISIIDATLMSRKQGRLLEEKISLGGNSSLDIAVYPASKNSQIKLTLHSDFLR
ncbi:MAG: hypothetical protein SGI97_03650 [candidate division Zixibacteria bacterium]|nr:hypothetical protein [candidate division Zixibacteria bacterium]